jgi:hypothetical protein
VVVLACVVHVRFDSEQIIFIVGMIVVTRVLAYLSLRYLNKPRR